MNIMMLLEMTSGTFPDRTAFTDGSTGVALTYSELFEAAKRRAATLRASDAERMVKLDVSNLGTPMSLFASAWAGVPYVPINYRLTNEEIAAARAANPNVIIVLEAAVLLEAGWQKAVDHVWCVVVSPEVAIERATARDGVDAAAVQARIDAQLSNDERTSQSDVVIDNSGDEAALLKQVTEAWNNLSDAEAEA